MSALLRLDLSDFPPSLASLLKPRVTRLGYLGEFFKCAAHQPEALEAFIHFTESGKKGLANQLVELIALTVASQLGNAYERNQHERLSLRLGLSREWIEAVNSLRPAAGPILSAQEQRVQSFVMDAIARNGHGSREHFESLVNELGQKAAVAVLMVMGRYVVHALIVNTLELDPPVPSIFDDGV